MIIANEKPNPEIAEVPRQKSRLVGELALGTMELNASDLGFNATCCFLFYLLSPSLLRALYFLYQVGNLASCSTG
ncbi:hypothetical protein VIGAN_07186500, partial [Vigna angularis var. angularis]